MYYLKIGNTITLYTSVYIYFYLKKGYYQNNNHYNYYYQGLCNFYKSYGICDRFGFLILGNTFQDIQIYTDFNANIDWFNKKNINFLRFRNRQHNFNDRAGIDLLGALLLIIHLDIQKDIRLRANRNFYCIFNNYWENCCRIYILNHSLYKYCFIKMYLLNNYLNIYLLVGQKVYNLIIKNFIIKQKN